MQPSPTAREEAAVHGRRLADDGDQPAAFVQARQQVFGTCATEPDRMIASNSLVAAEPGAVAEVQAHVGDAGATQVVGGECDAAPGRSPTTAPCACACASSAVP